MDTKASDKNSAEQAAEQDPLARFSIIEIESIGKWIRWNIIKDVVSSPHSSYGLKHLLENDTKIYMTNDEFKHAMDLAGYHPVDRNALNWQFKIMLTREINDNPNPFFRWAAGYSGKTGPEGDFVEDMLSDFEFPVFADKCVILRYLEQTGACGGAVNSFKKLWKKYEQEQKKQDNREGYLQ